MVVRAGENSRKGLEMFRSGEEEEEEDFGVMPRMRIEGGQEEFGGRDEEGCGMDIFSLLLDFLSPPLSCFRRPWPPWPVDGSVLKSVAGLFPIER